MWYNYSALGSNEQTILQRKMYIDFRNCFQQYLEFAPQLKLALLEVLRLKTDLVATSSEGAKIVPYLNSVVSCPHEAECRYFNASDYSSSTGMRCGIPHY